MSKRPCLDCGEPTQGSRCARCRAVQDRARDAVRGNTTQRGLGAEHQRQVAELKREAGPLSYCPRCGRAITKANPITGQHVVPRAHGGTKATELECKICNSSAGATIRRTF
jgi:HNH endonuclease